MKCKYEPCNNDAVGRSEYCGKSCRAKQSKRNRKAQPEQSATKAQPVKKAYLLDADFKHTLEVVGDSAVHATDKDRKDMAADYDQMIIGLTIDQPDISLLPANVTKPTGQRTAETAALSSQAMSRRVMAYNGQDWISSPEYAETTYRLLTMTVGEMNTAGQLVPVWKEAA